MSKEAFIKQQLALRGVFDYTEDDIRVLKKELINAIVIAGKDKYSAFEDAFYIWKRRKKNERNKV